MPHLLSNLIAASGIAATALTLNLITNQQALAVTFTETGDAGQLLGSAQDVGENIDTVLGSIVPSGDIDLYKLTFDFSGLVTFDALSSDFDPNLHLFNAAGNPLAADDDGGGFPNSRITFNITPGMFFLAVGANNINATDGAGTIISHNDIGVLVPNGVLGGWEGGGSIPGIGGTGNYTLTFSTPTAPTAQAVPEPSLTLLGAGTVLGFSTFLKRKLAKNR